MKKPLVLISYSREDKKYRDLLFRHLKILEYHHGVEVWDDQKILGGQDYSHEIEKILRSADIAIFLVSTDSLTSDYINRKELPILLERSKKEEVIFFPILVRPCAYEHINWLNRVQIRPRDGKPISVLDRISKQEKKCADIVGEIVIILKEKENRKVA